MPLRYVYTGRFWCRWRWREARIFRIRVYLQSDPFDAGIVRAVSIWVNVCLSPFESRSVSPRLKSPDGYTCASVSLYILSLRYRTLSRASLMTESFKVHLCRIRDTQSSTDGLKIHYNLHERYNIVSLQCINVCVCDTGRKHMWVNPGDMSRSWSA